MSQQIKIWLGVLGALVVALLIVLIWVVLMRGPGGVADAQTSSPTPSESGVTSKQSGTPDTSEPEPTESSPSPSTSPSDNLAPVPEGAIVLSQFESPSGNLQCQMDDQQVVCGVLQADWTPPGTDSCETPVRAVVLSEACVSAECASEAPVAPEGGLRVLEYGQTSTIGPWLCTSSERGIECSSRADGTGIVLARGSFNSYGPGRLG
ncbi:hypothetical protein [Salana multivorans]